MACAKEGYRKRPGLLWDTGFHQASPPTIYFYLHEVGVGHDDPLGHPGAAGGVHDDGGVLGREQIITHQNLSLTWGSGVEACTEEVAPAARTEENWWKVTEAVLGGRGTGLWLGGGVIGAGAKEGTE